MSNPPIGFPEKSGSENFLLFAGLDVKHCTSKKKIGFKRQKSSSSAMLHKNIIISKSGQVQTSGSQVGTVDSFDVTVTFDEILDDAHELFIDQQPEHHITCFIGDCSTEVPIFFSGKNPLQDNPSGCKMCWQFWERRSKQAFRVKYFL